MNANSFGKCFVIHTFGESHGPALGVVIDGCPAGLEIDKNEIQKEMDRRRPGFSATVSARQESDQVEILSGIFEGKTLGTPISMIVRNENARSQDYNEIKNKPRVGHADDVWKQKFSHTDHRGGGRSSGRETTSRVMAGAVAKNLIQKISPRTQIQTYIQQIGPHTLTAADESQFLESKKSVDQFPLRFPSALATAVEKELLQVQASGDSWGAQVRVVITNPTIGLGQPVFHKLKSDLAQALMSIGAVSAFELGAGMHSSQALGTDFHAHEGAQYGGIRGGISTGDPIVVTIYFKPTSSILDVAKKGRHDPCVAIRAIPVVESMVALVLADHLLWSRLDRV